MNANGLSLINQNVTLPGYGPYSFLLAPLSPDAAKNIVKRIGEIFKKHSSDEEQEADYLSQNLTEWGADVIKKWKQLNKTQPEIQNHFEVSFNQLNCILVDPLFKKPLQSPVVVRKWAWEKSRLVEFMKPPFDENPFCPFDGKPIGIVKPHALALDMLKLLHEVRPPLPTPPMEKCESKKVHTLKDLPQQSTIANFKDWIGVIQLAKEASDLQYELEKQKRAKELEIFAAELGEEFSQKLEVTSQDFKEEMAKDKEELNGQLTDLKATYKEIDAERVKQIESCKQQLKRTGKRVDNLKEVVVQKDGEIRSLRTEMRALSDSFLQAANDSDNDSCVIC